MKHADTMTDALYVAITKHPRATLVTVDVNLANAPTLGVDTLVP